MAVILLTRPRRRKRIYVTFAHPFKIRRKIQRNVKLSAFFGFPNYRFPLSFITEIVCSFVFSSIRIGI